MRGCSIYQRQDGWYLSGLSRTTAGVLLTSPPFIKLPLHATHILGRVCTQVIDESIDGVPHPTEFESQARPLLNLAGHKQWREFIKDVPYVDVIRDERAIRVSPTRNAWPEAGYDAAAAPPIVLALDASSQQIQEAILKAFTLCE